MPRNKGVGATRKRKAVPSAPNEVTANEDEPEEEEQPCDDDLIEEALDEVEGITIEKLADRRRGHDGEDSDVPSLQERVRGGRCSRSD